MEVDALSRIASVMSLRKINLTKDFLTYREAVRFIWNTFLRDYPDAEDDFPDIDRAMFKAIVNGPLNVDLVKRRIGTDSYFPDLEVKSLEKEVVKLTRQPDLHVWTREPRPPGVLLRYVGLFDYGWTDANRDFEFVQCIIVKSVDGKLTAVAGDNMLLVLARTARIKFIPPG